MKNNARGDLLHAFLLLGVLGPGVEADGECSFHPMLHYPRTNVLCAQLLAGMVGPCIKSKGQRAVQPVVNNSCDNALRPDVT